MEVSIQDGEKPKTSENIQVAEFYLNGVSPTKARSQRIRVTIKVNHEGIITVIAVCIKNRLLSGITRSV